MNHLSPNLRLAQRFGIVDRERRWSNRQKRLVTVLVTLSGCGRYLGAGRFGEDVTDILSPGQWI
jgi:hypothetical protein